MDEVAGPFGNDLLPSTNESDDAPADERTVEDTAPADDTPDEPTTTPDNQDPADTARTKPAEENLTEPAKPDPTADPAPEVARDTTDATDDATPEKAGPADATPASTEQTEPGDGATSDDASETACERKAETSAVSCGDFRRWPRPRAPTILIGDGSIYFDGAGTRVRCPHVQARVRGLRLEVSRRAGHWSWSDRCATDASYAHPLGDLIRPIERVLPQRVGSRPPERPAGHVHGAEPAPGRPGLAIPRDRPRVHPLRG